MNQKKFKIYAALFKKKSMYLRQIAQETGLAYGTVQSVIKSSERLLNTEKKGKEKYFSFKKNQETQLLAEQVRLEEKKRQSKNTQMGRLERLEAQSVYIIREAHANFENLCMLWSIGKDSTVLLWLARKAFAGHVPFTLVHIDTGYKIPQMITYRDELARKYKLDMVYGQNKKALEQKETFPDGKLTRLACCKSLKTIALKNTLSAKWPRWRMNHTTGKYEEDINKEPYKGVIVGVRADEEGSRSKERYFSQRNKENDWNIAGQPPELWNQFNTDFEPGAHVRIHPLLDWTEVDIWKYIAKENIPCVDLYFDNGKGERYRSLGCYPCTKPVKSTAKNPKEIVEELEKGKFANIAERSGREQDKEDGGGLETLRKEGYM